MKRQIAWFERTFPTHTDARLFPETIARVAGAPARMAALADGVSAEALTRREGETWSAQENIGHLADLDRILFIPRINQFAAGAETLEPADTSNATTWSAGHNERSLGEVLAEFERTRTEVVALLDAAPAERFARSAFHERLGIHMRLIDLCVFIAEHDDSHAARIRELLASR